MAAVVEASNLLSPRAAAALLGITESTLAVWRCRRRYPALRYIKVGGRIRYRREDIEHWLESRCVGTDVAN